VLATLTDSEEPLYKYQLLKRANISWKAASQCLDMLRVDNAVIRTEDGFERTAADWTYDHERIESVTQQRRRELARIKEFVHTDDCLTRFIDDELDGSLKGDCGRCANCMDPFLPTDVQAEGLVSAAREHYRSESVSEISPRYYTPEEDGRSKIDESRKPEPGRALSVYGDPGYGSLVSQQWEQGDAYSQELIDAAIEYIGGEWAPSPSPTWVTAVPSPTGEEKVQGLARRIPTGLGTEYVDAVDQVEPMQPQHELANSYQKRWNVEGAFAATGAGRPEPVLLIDDTAGSRWSFTEAALMLRVAGSGPVYPFALAERTRW
jgi:ATP-dependent DNA helicase RecQ